VLSRVIFSGTEPLITGTHTISLKTSKSLFEFSVNGMPCSFFATFLKLVPGSNNDWIAHRTSLYNLCDNSTMDANDYKK
jgi:hypothetical protein